MTRPEIEAVVKEIVLKSLVTQMFVEKVKEADDLADSGLDDNTILQSVVSTLEGDRDRLEGLLEAGYETDKIAMNHLIRDISDEIEKALPPQA